MSLNSFPFPERTVISQGQIDFCIGQFKAFIPQIVPQNWSPSFIPIRINACSRSSSDLLGISAMYCHKSPLNQTIVVSMLDSRISSLIESSNSSSWPTKDYLVGVQILISTKNSPLWWEIRQPGNARRHLGILETWTFRLHLTSNIYYNDCGTVPPYQRWVFIDSTWRTVTISIMVQAIYSQVKDRFCTSIPMMATLPVSVDGALWCVSEETWWQATLGFGRDLFTYQDFINQWSGG